MTSISTHILDTTIGVPAAGVKVILSQQSPDKKWVAIGNFETNDDGRVMDLAAQTPVGESGVFQIRFETAPYFERGERKTFYPFIEIAFEVDHTQNHYHVPLLLNAFGYSTYRGS
jgi:5-hydroxyisourate hydrolase